MTYADFISLCTSRSLRVQYDDSSDTVRQLFAYDGPQRYDAEVLHPNAAGVWPSGLTEAQEAQEAANLADFAAHYEGGANQPIVERSTEGLQQVNAVPGVDPKLACFCPPVSGDPTPAVPYVDYQVTDPFVQLFGMELEVVGAAKGDEIRFQVGYSGPSGFVVVSDYGGKKFISGDRFTMSFTSPRVSNPIPQGLKLRQLWVFATPSSPSTPSVSTIYHLQRPYGQ